MRKIVLTDGIVPYKTNYTAAKRRPSMNDQYYSTYSPRRAAQYLSLGAVLESVQEVQHRTKEIIKIEQEWKKHGKEGPIVEFIFSGATPEMKKQVRKMKYGRNPLSAEAVKHTIDILEGLIRQHVHEKGIPLNYRSVQAGLTSKEVNQAAVEKVKAEVHAIEHENRQLRSRAIMVRKKNLRQRQSKLCSKCVLLSTAGEKPKSTKSYNSIC